MKNAKKQQEIFNTFLDRYQEGEKYRSVRDTIFMMPKSPVLRIMNKELAIKTPAGIWHLIYDGKDWALPEKAFEYVGKTVKGWATGIRRNLIGQPKWDKKGNIYCKYSNNSANPAKEFAIFNINKWAEIVEEQQPLFTTDEAEIYHDGKGVEIFKGDEYFMVDKQTLQVYARLSNGEKPHKDFKRFATEQAAEDYIKLETLRREAGLKVGDKVNGEILDNIIESGGQSKTGGQAGSWKDNTNIYRNIPIIDFKMVNNVPCFVVKSVIFDSGPYYYSLQSYIDHKKKQQQKDINTHPLIEDALNNLRTAINETYDRK